MATAPGDCRLQAFRTALGWMSAAWGAGGLAALTFGHDSAESAVAALQRVGLSAAGTWVEGVAGDPTAERLVAYAEGSPVGFADLPVDYGDVTAFQRTVLDECRRIPYGSKATYGQLAARAGSPRASRAVGSVMARNRVPLLVPCHRVIGSSGSLGGYSAPSGKSMKLRLLSMEGAVTDDPPERLCPHWKDC